MNRVAAIDIGTNTVRLLVAEPGRDRRPTATLRAHRVVTLGEGVDAAGRFADAAIARALAGLGELVELAGPVERLDAVATSATRDAANRDEFLDRAAVVLGVRPRVITGDEEARLAFAGATGGGGTVPTVVIDVGGGSTEVVFGTADPDFVASVDVGSVRLTERVLPERPSAPHRVDAALGWAIGRFSIVEPLDPPGLAIGVAGTFTALAAIDADLDGHADEAVHGHRLLRTRLEGLVGRLAGLTVEETAAIPSLEAARAPALLGGAVTALAAMTHLGLDAVEVRVTDLLDAVAADLLS
ncbi:MAG: exopolyphosphatase [Acidimicrobiia bacterium]